MIKTEKKSIGIVSSAFDDAINKVIKNIEKSGIQVKKIYPTLKSKKEIKKAYSCDLYFFCGHEGNYNRYLQIFKNETSNIVNSACDIERLVNKCKIYNKLKKGGILIPEYKIIKSIKEIPKDPKKYPLILKPCMGSRKRDIFILKSIDDAPKNIKELNILQKYIPFEAEYKCYCVEKNIYFHSKSKNKLSDGQKKKLEKIIRKCGDILNINLYGLDIVLYKKSFYLIDFNVTFRGCLNINAHLADYAKYLVKKVS